MGELNADEIRHISFKKAPQDTRGYSEQDVDALRDRLAAMWRGSGPPISAADVHNVVFRKSPLGRRGYDEETVDAFLDTVEATLRGDHMPDRAGAQSQEAIEPGANIDNRFNQWLADRWYGLSVALVLATPAVGIAGRAVDGQAWRAGIGDHGQT